MLAKLSELKRLIKFLKSELSRQSKETGKLDSSPPGPRRPKDNKLGNEEKRRVLVGWIFLLLGQPFNNVLQNSKL